MNCFELIEIYCTIRVNSLNKYRVSNNDYKKKNVVVNCSPLDYSYIPIKHWGYNNNWQSSVNKQIKNVPIYCFCWFDMFSFDQKNLVEIERHHESLFNKGIYQPKSYCSFKLILHIDYAYYFVHIIPNKRNNVCHENKAF